MATSRSGFVDPQGRPRANRKPSAGQRATLRENEFLQEQINRNRARAQAAGAPRSTVQEAADTAKRTARQATLRAKAEAQFRAGQAAEATQGGQNVVDRGRATLRRGVDRVARAVRGGPKVVQGANEFTRAANAAEAPRTFGDAARQAGARVADATRRGTAAVRERIPTLRRGAAAPAPAAAPAAAARSGLVSRAVRGTAKLGAGLAATDAVVRGVARSTTRSADELQARGNVDGFGRSTGDAVRAGYDAIGISTADGSAGDTISRGIEDATRYATENPVFRSAAGVARDIGDAGLNTLRRGRDVLLGTSTAAPAVAEANNATALADATGQPPPVASGGPPTPGQTFTGEPLVVGEDPRRLVNPGTGVVIGRKGLRTVGDGTTSANDPPRVPATAAEEPQGFRRGGRGIFSTLYDAGRIQGLRNREAADRSRAAASAQQEFKNSVELVKLAQAQGRQDLALEQFDNERSQQIIENLSDPNKAPVAQQQLLQGFSRGESGGPGEALIMGEVLNLATPGANLKNFNPLDAINLYLNEPPPFTFEDINFDFQNGEATVGGQSIFELDELPTPVLQAIKLRKAQENRATLRR